MLNNNFEAREYRTSLRTIPPIIRPSRNRLTLKPQNDPITSKSSDEIIHLSSDIQTVMDEVLRSGTDNAHCFFNEGSLRERLSIFRDYFIPEIEERRIIYAMKANPRERIMEILKQEGLDGFDCASLNEINSALNIPSVRADNIYFNNPIKKQSAINGAYMSGVRYYTAQSRSGIQKILDSIDQYSDKATQIAVRIETQNPEACINLSSKYGCSPIDALELSEQVRNGGANLGLAMHTGSQNTNPKSFGSGIRLLTNMARYVGRVSSLNLGGGFPANHLKQDNYDLQSYLEHVSRSIRPLLHNVFKQGETQPKIIIEPGRAIAAETIDLAIPILEIDQRGKMKRVFMDDGVFTSFSDWPVHEWKYDFNVFTRDGRVPSRHMTKTTLFGRTCDSGDTMGEIYLPDDIQEGDFLWVKNAGAYMDSQASGFNGFGTPNYVSYNI